MEVYRLSREKFAKPLNGKGAAIKGARWNSVGVELIYTAQNRSLAMAEVAVHLTFATLPDDFVMMVIDIPDSVKILEYSEKDLPFNWNSFPHPDSTQKIGDKFVFNNSYCVLKIPSVVTKGEFNYLINPHNSDFIRVKIISLEQFPFDNRIFK